MGSSSKLRICLCLPVLALALACGPVAATSVIDDAEVALSRAHASEGDKFALYETTLADLYLVKAREEQGHARYSDASDLGEAAFKFAETAARKAGERRTSGAPAQVPAAEIERQSRTPAVEVPPSATPAAAPAATPSATPSGAPLIVPAPKPLDEKPTAPKRAPAQPIDPDATTSPGAAPDAKP